MSFDFEPVRVRCEALLATAPLAELASNPTSKWVGDGLPLHRDGADCAFCDQPLPTERVARLEAHFSEDVRRSTRAACTRRDGGLLRIRVTLRHEGVSALDAFAAARLHIRKGGLRS